MFPEKKNHKNETVTNMVLRGYFSMQFDIGNEFKKVSTILQVLKKANVIINSTLYSEF